jgi:anti-sigma factor RsiW
MNEIVCASGVAQLMDYLEGIVSTEVRTELEAHVAGCPRCLAFVKSYLATPCILREATAIDVPHEVAQALSTFLKTRLK